MPDSRHDRGLWQTTAWWRAAADGLVFSRRAGLVLPRDAVEDAVAAAGNRRSGRTGSPPHVMVYLVMALASFAGVQVVPARAASRRASPALQRIFGFTRTEE